MRAALVMLAACGSAPPPVVEHHAVAPSTETFMLDAPLFDTTDITPVVWTLARDGETAHLLLGDREYTGSVREARGRLELALGAVTMDCTRTAVQAHVAGSEPAPRVAHAVCGVPRRWQPAELVATAALTCTVRREHLTTEVTMAPPPGLQAIVDDCCDDEDRCERRWEIRRRR